MILNEQQIEKKYLGIPYKHLGREIDGLDCYGLIKCVFKDIGYDLIDLEDYAVDWSKNGGNHFLENYYKQFEEVPTHHPFDVVLFQNNKGVANHAGIVLTRNRFLHTCRAGTVIASLHDARWQKKITGFYRFTKYAPAQLSSK